MNLDNKTKHTVGYEKVKNTEKTSLPPNMSLTKSFVGENMGVNGRMKKVTSKNTT